MRSDPFVNEAKALLVGWTVTDVQPSQASKGLAFHLILAKGAQRRAVDIACSMEPWIDQAVDLPDNQDGTDHEVHPDFEIMMRSMEHHMFYAKVPDDMIRTEPDSDPGAPAGSTVTFDNVGDFAKDDDLSNLFAPLEDVFKRQIGFRCTVTGKEWWCSLNAVKQSRHKHRLATPEDRTQFSRHPPFWPDLNKDKKTLTKDET